MDASRFVILGANGQLGKALRDRYPQARAVDRAELDITNPEALSQFDWGSFDTILNAAAFTNVDGAETTEGRRAAWQINATAPGALARIATEHNLTLVHISSEYVFDGTETPHTEDEPLTPLGVYAQSKAAGDIAASVAPKHYIFRVSWLIGDGPNFVRTMMSLADKDVSPKVVGDQIGRLTFTTTLVDTIDHVLQSKPAFGVYNVSDDGEPASWANVTRKIFEELGRTDLTVTDTTTAEYFANKPEASPRPLQSTLDLTKIKATGVQLPNWQTSLHEYIAREQSLTAAVKE